MNAPITMKKQGGTPWWGWKRRRKTLEIQNSKKRLLGFRAYLYEKHAYSTTKSIFSKLLAFYRHLEIEIRPLFPISTKNIDEVAISFKDLPDKNIIKKALKISIPLMKSIILFMSSSAVQEWKHWTLQCEFIKATEDCHNRWHLWNTQKDERQSGNLATLLS